MSTTKSLLQLLSTICTRDESGKHFTEVYSADDLARMTVAELIEISRPAHPNGVEYSQEYWSVSVTDKGIELLEDRDRAEALAEYEVLVLGQKTKKE